MDDDSRYYSTSTSGAVTLALSIGDVNSAWALAQARNKKESKLGAMTYKPENGWGGIGPHLIGMLGELAVARYLGLDPDVRIFSRSGAPGADLTARDGKTIQVKTTTYAKDPWLRVETHHPACNFYVLAVVHVKPGDEKNPGGPIWIREVRKEDVSAIVTLVGWADRATVLLGKRTKLRENGPENYVLTGKSLAPLSQLKLLVQNGHSPEHLSHA